MRSVSWVSLSFIVASLSVLAACGDEVKGGTGGNGGSGASQGGGTVGGGGTGGMPPQGTSNKVDLLFVVDNSRSMADKQTILAGGVPQMLGFLTNPRCIDDTGAVVAQPGSADEECPAGSQRELAPVKDLHVGVITSSIGSHGADACDPGQLGNSSPTVNDDAHLIDRADLNGGTVPTYQNLSFLAWDPNGAKMPPGESDPNALSGNLASLIQGAGEVGCGYEAPLEAWYRFLVEPDPYDAISIVDNVAELQGTDQVLLDQRANFLRPDSVLMVVMLTDENDCSTRDGGQFYFSNQVFVPGTNQPYHLPAPRAACANDPNDPCCTSCGQAPGDGCDTSQDQCLPLSTIDDNINLRCFDQKRRFGIDFKWPTDRYVAGLSDSEVVDRYGSVVPNPVFAGTRDPSMVYLTGIVGVPWQDIARRDANGAPDIAGGLNADGAPVGGYMSAAELAATSTWDVILGDPANYVPPSDPLMQESVDPRSGVSPITGEPIAPPGSPLLANSANGHEYSIPFNDDLQYSCVFELPTPKDCNQAGNTSCDCNDPSTDSPLCQAPNGSFGVVQYYAKAYPGVRQLSVLKGLGNQGVVGSICPVQLSDGNAPGFAYQPTFGAIAMAASAAIVE